MIPFITEFLGTFFFVSVILHVGEPIPIAVALLAAIYFTSRFSKSNINPAVSVALFARGDMSGSSLLGYVAAQVLGALAAFAWLEKAQTMHPL
jgi:glycerol uptake facilitator-like aquaporin